MADDLDIPDAQHVEDEGDDDEELGDLGDGSEATSSGPQKEGEERPIGHAGLKKKLVVAGKNWATPEKGDEVKG